MNMLAACVLCRSVRMYGRENYAIVFSVGYHDVPVILQAKERRLFLESKLLLVFTDVGFQFGIVFGEVVNKARIHVH